MKVYVITPLDSSPVAVYSTRQAAEEHQRKVFAREIEPHLEEWNPPNQTVEQYREYHLLYLSNEITEHELDEEI